MVEAGVWLAAIGVGVFLLLIPVSVRLLKGVLGDVGGSEPAESEPPETGDEPRSRPPEQGTGT